MYYKYWWNLKFTPTDSGHKNAKFHLEYDCSHQIYTNLPGFCYCFILQRIRQAISQSFKNDFLLAKES